MIEPLRPSGEMQLGKLQPDVQGVVPIAEALLVGLDLRFHVLPLVRGPREGIPFRSRRQRVPGRLRKRDDLLLQRGVPRVQAPEPEEKVQSAGGGPRPRPSSRRRLLFRSRASPTLFRSKRISRYFSCGGSSLEALDRLLGRSQRCALPRIR